MSRNDLIKTMQKNTDTLKSYGVKKLGVFGSFGTSRQHSKSDVDILVEFNKEDKTFDNYMELKAFLEKLFQRRVDLVIKDALKARIKTRVLSETAYARL
jgi:predicted nucleotidyltransferase